jgi:hypothetical protein
MAKSRKLPNFDSLDQAVEFFETHDLGDYWDELPEAQFEVDIQRRTHLFALDDDIAAEVAAIAQERHVPSRQLINTWLREKVMEQAHLKGNAA